MSDEGSQFEQLADQFDQQWRQGNGPKVSEYLELVDSRSQQTLLRRLLPIDIEYRRRQSEDVSASDYVSLGGDAVRLASRLIATPTTSEGADEDHLHISYARKDDMIGPYRLIEKLGEGGMGVVWKAHQTEPVKRFAALKLIKSGFADKQLIARFEAERQALALMNSKNIARVFDVGTTDEGLPWFAMELIDGVPITEHCNAKRLAIRKRLSLFVEVCRAVQHAHQKGIIHRDLKPSNVMITSNLQQSIPKVIDFSLAKALQHGVRLTDKTLMTDIGQVVGTLQYMSPEQATLDTVDIDTRSDIYSLGVILYELLTHSTPVQRKTAKTGNTLKVLAMIRDSVPPRPSQRLSESDKRQMEIASLMCTDPESLRHVLRGDLDWIVMKALEKDRERRYESANEMARDVERYLNGAPVTARPPSRVYLARKFVSRNRGLVTASIATLFLLLAGIAGTSIGFVQATRAAKNATREAKRADKEARKSDLEKRRADEKAAEAIAQRKRAEFALYTGKMNLAAQAALENEPARVLDLLSEQIPQQGEEDLRGFEWHYLWDKIHPGLKMTFGLEGSYSMTSDVSPDGKYFAHSGAIEKGPDPACLAIHDLDSGERLSLLRNKDLFAANFARFSWDGRYLCLARNMTNDAAIVEFPSLKLVTRFSCQGVSIRAFCWSKDNQSVFLAGGNATVVEHDAKSGKRLNDLSNLSDFDGFHALHLSPNGNQLFASSHWGKNGKQTTVFDIEKAPYSFVRSVPDCMVDFITPDGTVAVGRSEKRTLITLAPVTLKRIGDFPKIYAECTHLAPDHDCFLTGGKESRLASFWDSKTGEEMLRIAHNRALKQVGCLPGDRGWFSMDNDGVVKVWDWRAVEQARKNGNRLADSQIPNLKGATLFPWSKEGDAIVCSGESCTLVNSLTGSTNSFRSEGNVVSTNNGPLSLVCAQLNTLAESHSVDLCNKDGVLKRTVEIQLPDRTKTKLLQVELASNNRWLVARLEKTGFISMPVNHNAGPLLIYDLAGNSKKSRVLDIGNCMDFDISSDGQLLLTCSQGGFVGIWDLETGFLMDRPQAMYSGESFHQQVAFSPDCKLAATAFEDGTVCVWEIDPPTEKFSGSVANFFEDSWSAPRTLLASFVGQTNRTNEIRFFPDSNLLAVACGNAIRLLDVQRQQERISLTTPGSTTHVVISDDGKNLFALLYDGSVLYFRTDPKHCNWNLLPGWQSEAKEAVAAWLQTRFNAKYASVFDAKGFEAYMALLAFAIQGKTSDYRALRKSVLEHYRDSRDLETCERLLRALALLPIDAATEHAIQSLKKKCLNPDSDVEIWPAAFASAAVAMAECRQGNYEEALERLEQLPSPNGGPDWIWELFLLADAIKAVAHHNLGEPGLAMELVNRCRQKIVEKQPFIRESISYRWHQTSLPQYLIDEISTEIESTKKQAK